MNDSSGYTKVPFDAEDIEEANSKFPTNLLAKKQLWLIILIPFVLLGIFIGLVVLVIMAINHFRPPSAGFGDRIITILYLLPFLVFVFIIVQIQNVIDHKLGYKKVGFFRITTIVNLVTAKVLILDSWRIFRIDKYNPIFKSVEKSKTIKVEKTATGRLLYDLTINDRLNP